VLRRVVAVGLAREPRDRLERDAVAAVAEHLPRRSRPETPDDLRVGARPDEDADGSERR
jgi:hypothetical protein